MTPVLTLFNLFLKKAYLHLDEILLSNSSLEFTISKNSPKYSSILVYSLSEIFPFRLLSKSKIPTIPNLPFIKTSNKESKVIEGNFIT